MRWFVARRWWSVARWFVAWRMGFVARGGGLLQSGGPEPALSLQWARNGKRFVARAHLALVKAPFLDAVFFAIF